jgi:P2 family phage contractile tail tube protein
MPQNVTIGRLTNANLYMDGGPLFGKAESVNLPEVPYKQAEHKALGLNGTIEYYAGIDKLEGSIKWTSFYADQLKKMGDPFTAKRIIVYGNLEGYQGGSRTSQDPVKAFMTIMPKNFPLGNFQQHDNVELESKFGCVYVRLEIKNEVIYELDVEANIWKVGGVDLLATYRQNLGL